jgi:GrpB-like predicted nucleotidyltransferase (UPF0157 family)/GNAT superfamily N-acetyltransferase
MYTVDQQENDVNNIVEVVPYDVQWLDLFESEAALIKSVLGHNCIAIHHIGSTAVPGLKAKPIIDILPVVKDILQVDKFNSEMTDLGYDVKGEHGILFRRFFQKVRTHNVHVFGKESPEIDRHLKFRDWMRTHVEDRNAYAALKSDLALKYPNDILKYCFGKDVFVADIDCKTGVNGLRAVQALTDCEWEAVRHLRQKYFFDRKTVDDPYTWTFKDAQHNHLVLYKGPKIVGYANIQKWPENSAILRIIVIDELYRNKGIGSDFLRLCERWLSHHKRKKLFVQSSPAAYKFYCRKGYLNMTFIDPEGFEVDPQDTGMVKDLT